jgi:LPS sulfotransferase NodH
MRFVIIASARTGSTFLVSRLNRARDVFCHQEVFHRHRPLLRIPAGAQLPYTEAELTDLRANDPEAFLEFVFQQSFGRPHVGFKIFGGQHDVMLDKIIRTTAIRKIVLYRRNVLANYASLLSARATGRFGLRDRTVAEARPLIQFKEKPFLRFHNKYQEFYSNVTAQIGAAAQEFLFYCYEDVANSKLFANLLRFVGSETNQAEEKPREREDATDVLSRFSNPDDARRFIEEHGLVHWQSEAQTLFAPLQARPR